MSQAEDRLRAIKARLDRLRQRLKSSNIELATKGVLLGMLDLLEDEL